MAGSDKRKQSLYFPEEMLKEIQDEAARQDRSLSWIVQKAWKLARKDIMKYPSVNEFPGEDDERGAAEYIRPAPRTAVHRPTRVCRRPRRDADLLSCHRTTGWPCGPSVRRHRLRRLRLEISRARARPRSSRGPLALSRP